MIKLKMCMLNILLILLLNGCIVGPNKKLIDLFSLIDSACLLKIQFHERFNSPLVIDNDDLSTFINELKKISNLHEYTSTYSIGNEFKESYKLIFFHLKTNKVIPVLYSTKYSAMIIRKSDVFKEHKDEYPKITVYEFKITQKATDILIKYEQRLPEDGMFFNSWPTP